VTYSEATTYTYDVISTLRDPCHKSVLDEDLQCE
jgi:hypothetical protein